jgi:hypothetical protein
MAIFPVMIKSLAPTAAALFLLLPLVAQADDAPPPEPPGRLEQLEDRARRALDLFSDELGGLLRGLGDGLGRLDDYGPPQILPNGDILIPRRRDPPAEDTPQTTPQTTLDL